MPTYSITNLGTFGGQYPEVSALSDAGVAMNVAEEIAKRAVQKDLR